MADWLRLWHGTVTDTKFLWVARRSGARFGDVMTVWLALLEEASQQKKRGDVTGFDVAQCARLLGIDPGAVRAIVQAMEGRFVKNGRVMEDPRRPIFVQAPDGRLPTPEWKGVRARIFERDNYTCQYCGARGVALECDHVFPISKGGSNEDDNLVAACAPCNRSKGAMTLEQWRAKK